MAAVRLGRIMASQYRKACTDGSPNLIPIMDEENVRVWHFLILNVGGPHAGGEYLFRLDAPSDFPAKPPKFSFLTKNGVFEPGGSICISIGEFHANDRPGQTGSHGWRPTLGMIGFAREVVNGLIASAHGGENSLGDGIRLRNDSPEKKRELAAASAQFNSRNHSDLMRAVEQFAETHPDNPAVILRRVRSSSKTLARDLLARGATGASFGDFRAMLAAAMPTGAAPADVGGEVSALYFDTAAVEALQQRLDDEPTGIAASLRSALVVFETPLRRARLLRLSIRETSGPAEVAAFIGSLLDVAGPARNLLEENFAGCAASENAAGEIDAVSPEIEEFFEACTYDESNPAERHRLTQGIILASALAAAKTPAAAKAPVFAAAAASEPDDEIDEKLETVETPALASVETPALASAKAPALASAEAPALASAKAPDVRATLHGSAALRARLAKLKSGQ